MRPSSSALPNNCNPIGSRCPSTSAKPHGTLIPQFPARLAAMVKISARYICNGSATRSPNLNAGTGEVRDQCIDFLEGSGEILANQPTHFLRAQIIGVVITGA